MVRLSLFYYLLMANKRRPALTCAVLESPGPAMKQLLRMDGWMLAERRAGGVQHRGQLLRLIRASCTARPAGWSHPRQQRIQVLCMNSETIIGGTRLLLFICWLFRVLFQLLCVCFCCPSPPTVSDFNRSHFLWNAVSKRSICCTELSLG